MNCCFFLVNCVYVELTCQHHSPGYESLPPTTLPVRFDPPFTPHTFGVGTDVITDGCGGGGGGGCGGGITIAGGGIGCVGKSDDDPIMTGGDCGNVIGLVSIGFGFGTAGTGCG